MKTLQENLQDLNYDLAVLRDAVHDKASDIPQLGGMIRAHLRAVWARAKRELSTEHFALIARPLIDTSKILSSLGA